MRMRRLPWASEFIRANKIVVSEPERLKGRWSKYLNSDCIHLEIGSGKGDYWIKMANMNLDCGWIGMEKNESVAAIALRKYDETICNNNHMAFIYNDACNLLNYFDVGEIDVIHLNFSDPWPKKRAHKHRLSSNGFIEQYYDILKDNGLVIMKSDNYDLFHYSLEMFSNAKWECCEQDNDYRSRLHDEDAISEYENKFMQLNKPIYRAIWRKCK